MNTNMTNFIYGKTQQGKTLLILDEHDFAKKLDTKTTPHKRNAKRRSHICPIILITCEYPLILLITNKAMSLTPVA